MKKVLGLFTLQLLLYHASNRILLFRPATLPLYEWERALPYFGWLFVPYALILPLCYVTLYSFSRSRQFPRLLGLVLQLMLVHFALHTLSPVLYPRGEALQGIPHSPALLNLMSLVFSFDKSASCFPALNVSYPLVMMGAAWLLHERRKAYALAALSLFAMLAALLTKEHYAWDLAGSVAVALFILSRFAKKLRHSTHSVVRAEAQ